MTHKVEADWIYKGFRCAVVLCDDPLFAKLSDLEPIWRCGYVGIPPGHPFYGLKMDDPIPSEFQKAIKDLPNQEIGDRGMIDLVIHALESGNGEAARFSMLFDVHGSLTYAGENKDREKGGWPYPIAEYDDNWWIGFDCHHYQDMAFHWSDVRTKAECERLVDQIIDIVRMATQ